MTKHNTRYSLPAACMSRRAPAAWGALLVIAATGEPSVLLLPDSHTTTGRILADLLRGTRHTHRTIFLYYGLYRGSDQISRLRKCGWPIETRMVRDGARRDQTALVAEYFLPVEFLVGVSGPAVWDFILKTRAYL